MKTRLRGNMAGDIFFCACLIDVLFYVGALGTQRLHVPASLNLVLLLIAAFGLPASLLFMRRSFVVKAVGMLLVAALVYVFAVFLTDCGLVAPANDQCMLAGHHHTGGSDLPLVASLFIVWFFAVSAVYLCIGALLKFFSRTSGRMNKASAAR